MQQADVDTGGLLSASVTTYRTILVIHRFLLTF